MSGIKQDPAEPTRSALYEGPKLRDKGPSQRVGSLTMTKIIQKGWFFPTGYPPAPDSRGTLLYRPIRGGGRFDPQLDPSDQEAPFHRIPPRLPLSLADYPSGFHSPHQLGQLGKAEDSDPDHVLRCAIASYFGLHAQGCQRLLAETDEDENEVGQKRAGGIAR